MEFNFQRKPVGFSKKARSAEFPAAADTAAAAAAALVLLLLSTATSMCTMHAIHVCMKYKYKQLTTVTPFLKMNPFIRIRISTVKSTSQFA
jgi:hypothetical protein